MRSTQVRSRSHRSTHLRRAVAAERAHASGNIVATAAHPRAARLAAALRRISPRGTETGISRRERLTGTCDMHRRVRATGNVGQRSAPRVRSESRRLIKRNGAAIGRARTHAFVLARRYTCHKPEVIRTDGRLRLITGATRKRNFSDSASRPRAPILNYHTERVSHTDFNHVDTRTHV